MPHLRLATAARNPNNCSTSARTSRALLFFLARMNARVARMFAHKNSRAAKKEKCRRVEGRRLRQPRLCVFFSSLLAKKPSPTVFDKWPRPRKSVTEFRHAEYDVRRGCVLFPGCLSIRASLPRRLAASLAKREKTRGGSRISDADSRKDRSRDHKLVCLDRE